jgi:hypothetical protein
MAMAIGNTKVQLKATGTSVTIPDSPKAKLMYYLNSVCGLLELDSSDSADIQELRNYNRYWALTEEQTLQLLVFCSLLSPDVLLNKIIFQNDGMCGNSSNEFYDIGLISNRMVVSESIVIGGQSRSVKKIMTFKMSWLRQNYIEPMQALSSQLQTRQAQQRRARDDSCVIL